MVDIEKEVLRAEQRIRPHVRETPLEPSLWFTQHTGASAVFFKLENLQVTGSFKFRGAMNKLSSLSEEEKAKGCVTSSSGNHGAAFCQALQSMVNRNNVKGTVFLSENVSATKLSKIQLYQKTMSKPGLLTIQQYGTNVADTEAAGRRFAEQNGMTYVPPYNDAQIIGGQGTIGVEIVRQVNALTSSCSAEPLDAVFISIGGGGLISGVGTYLKSVWPACEIVGCSPINSAVMAESIKAGHILLDMESSSLPTLSDGTAGGLEADTITFAICRDIVDTHILVSEQEIALALNMFMAHHQMLIEGAAAVAIAGLLQRADAYKGKRVAVVICGCNISLGKLKPLL